MMTYQTFFYREKYRVVVICFEYFESDNVVQYGAAIYNSGRIISKAEAKKVKESHLTTALLRFEKHFVTEKVLASKKLNLIELRTILRKSLFKNGCRFVDGIPPNSRISNLGKVEVNRLLLDGKKFRELMVRQACEI